MCKCGSIPPINPPVTETEMIKPNTRIRATKLINFRGDYAEFHQNGIIYPCTKRKGHWYTSDIYFYG